MLYGHSRLYTLRGADGHLCHRLWAAPGMANVVLFTDPKLLKKWLDAATKAGWKLEVQPGSITQMPPHLSATINPADDAPSMGIILKKMFYENW